MSTVDLEPRSAPHPRPEPGAPVGEGTTQVAFFDVDGTLIRTNLLHLYAYYAANSGSIWGSLSRLGKLAASAPYWWALDGLSRHRFNLAFFRSYEGLSEDRLFELADELHARVVREALFPGARRLVARLKAAGVKVVLVTGALDFTVRPLADELGADDLIANRLEFVGHRATGRVIPPLIEGASKAAEIRRWAEGAAVPLSRCAAYSDSWSDFPMLAVVGRPVAVRPELRLRDAARAYGWPVIALDEDSE